MLFPSIEFAIFFAVVLVVAWTLMAVRQEALRKWFLLLASLAFYAFWNIGFALLLMAVATVAFAVGLATVSVPRASRRRLWFS